MKNKKRICSVWCLVLTVMLLGGTIAAGFIGGRWYIDNKIPNFQESYFLYVYPETSLAEISDSLSTGAGMLRPRSLDRAFRKVGLCDGIVDGAVRNIRPGKYEISPETTSVGVARKLLFGWQTADNHLVLSGTLRMKDRLAQRISRQMMVDSTTVMNALCDSAFLSRYGRTPEDVFGFFLKDSYEMYWTLSIDEIFNRFQREYERFWNEERRAAAAVQGLTPKQVEVLASIVTGESLMQEEYPTIAGVYLNRYHRGMRLQADPTIAFCHDYTLDRILKKHLAVDSPYNTYRHTGLPPAPINVPEKAALEAVLHPDSHRYLYFCASPDFDGTHDFAATYTEHLRNARKFQRALTERRRAQAAVAGD